MTVQQTIDVPASHRLMLEVPREVPVGPTVLTFTPKTEEGSKSAVPITDRFAEAAHSAASHADFLLGICASAGDITLEQIREERLVNKYLK